MKAFLLVVSIAVVFAVPFIQEEPRESKRTGKEATCPCPPTILPEDLSDKAMLKSVRRRIAKQLWNNTIPALTEKGKKMRGVLKKMLNSDSPTWNSKSWSATSWAWSFLPYNATNPLPSTCEHARLINATVQWERASYPRDTTALFAALDGIEKASIQSFKNIGNSALVSAMCTPTPPVFVPATCYANGTAYMLDEIWNVDSNNMPYIYELTTRDLYTSSNFSDRILGAMTTTTISQPFADILDIFNPNIHMELMSLQNAGPLAMCCCTPLTDRLNVLYALHTAELQRTINIVKTKYAMSSNPEETNDNIQ